MSARFRVALTFDAEHPDRPTAPAVAERLLDALVRLEVPANFFIQGRWAEAYPPLARRIVTDGHLVGSHSHYHARMPLLTDEGLAADIESAGEAIHAAAMVDPRPWFRCPFGAGMDDPRVRLAIDQAGYRHVGWNVAGEDWRPDLEPESVRDTVLAGCRRHGDGAVVLLHTWPDRMLGALDGIVTGLRADGATFIRIDALEDPPTGGSSVDELGMNGGAPA